MKFDLLILGASVRAAAESAVRAGYHPWCADFFADRDLASICPVERITPGAAGFERLARRLESLPSTPWFYTGGFEHHPEVVDQICRRHPLWGISGQPLERVRDPERLAQALSSAGLNALPVQRTADGLPQDGTWLVKPLQSGGGIGIKVHISHDHTNSTSIYFQRRANGKAFSALFLAAPDETRLLGVTRQLVGMTNDPFLYRGNIGPVIVRDSTRGQLTRIGQCLGKSFCLKGWFGVDYVDDGTSVWPVEVNPRYTASIEIHELAWQRAILPAHIAACVGAGENLSLMSFHGDRHPDRIVAKRVLYATKTIQVDNLDWYPSDNRGDFTVREIADIPSAGTCFQAGEPVLTVLAEGVDVADCESQLSRRAERWSSRFDLT